MTKLASAFVLIIPLAFQELPANAELVIQATKTATRTEGGPRDIVVNLAASAGR